MAKWIAVTELIIREKITMRGGGVEIDLTRKGFSGHKMTAYQNYLGGGMLGAVGNDCTILGWSLNPKLRRIAEELAQYFHEQTNPDSEWEGSSFEENQKRSLSAY